MSPQQKYFYSIFRYRSLDKIIFNDTVLGVKGGGVHSEAQVFDDEIIERRSKSIGYAIEARKAKYKDEEPYSYKPFKDSRKTYVWNSQTRKDLKDYNLEDLSI